MIVLRVDAQLRPSVGEVQKKILEKTDFSPILVPPGGGGAGPMKGRPKIVVETKNMFSLCELVHAFPNKIFSLFGGANSCQNLRLKVSLWSDELEPVVRTSSMAHFRGPTWPKSN